MPTPFLAPGRPSSPATPPQASVPASFSRPHAAKRVLLVALVVGAAVLGGWAAQQQRPHFEPGNAQGNLVNPVGVRYEYKIVAHDAYGENVTPNRPLAQRNPVIRTVTDFANEVAADGDWELMNISTSLSAGDHHARAVVWLAFRRPLR